MKTCDRSSGVTDESWIFTLCKLRAGLRRASPFIACALSLEVLLKPPVCLRRAQNRPYLDRNAYSGQYSKMTIHKPRFFDFSGLEPIQTNVCIGRSEWCRYNAPPREKGGLPIITLDVNVKAITDATPNLQIRKKTVEP
ncbi:hypothetical protein [Pseudomonas sp. PB103]|jgi:hypothetical protein|uniref:hypothetical protein n=1 Tax=Pseudomonas sp. PB103 TaxID=2494698 RepID=UPI00131BBD77|nr:hypothetical protein [Pseudomonas sp. PB103]